MKVWIERMWEFEGWWGKFAVLWLAYLVGQLVACVFLAEWRILVVMLGCTVFHVWYWDRQLRGQGAP